MLWSLIVLIAVSVAVPAGVMAALLIYAVNRP